MVASSSFLKSLCLEICSLVLHKKQVPSERTLVNVWSVYSESVPPRVDTKGDTVL